MDIASVEASGNPPEMFELVEAAFDPIAHAIKLRIMVEDHLAVALAGNDCLHALRSDEFSQGIAVIPLVGNDSLGTHSFQKRRCTGDVGGLAWREDHA